MEGNAFWFGATLYATYHYISYVNRLKWKDIHSGSEIVSLPSALEYHPQNNGKLVLLNGNIWGTKQISDNFATTPVIAPDQSVAVIRTVQRYVVKRSGKTTKRYWEKIAEDSHSVIQTKIFRSPSYIGSFWISDKLIDQICETAEKAPLQLPYKILTIKNTPPLEFKKNNDWYYYTQNKGKPRSPRAGDIRIQYFYVPPDQQMTILATQQKFKLEAFDSPSPSAIPGSHNLSQFIDTVIHPKYHSMYQWMGVIWMHWGHSMENKAISEDGCLGGCHWRVLDWN